MAKKKKSDHKDAARVESSTDLTEKEKQYIRDNHRVETVSTMCMKLGRLSVEAAGPIFEAFMLQEDLSNSSTHYRREKAESASDVEFEDATWNNNKSLLIESLLDEEDLLPIKDVILKAGEMSRIRKLKYFVWKSKVMFEDEFQHFVRMMGDLTNEYGEKFNMADDFHTALELCASRILLQRQDEYEKNGDKRYDQKLRTDLQKSVLKEGDKLAISRSERLKRESDSVKNLAEVSSHFGEETAREGINEEDKREAVELMDTWERIAYFSSKKAEEKDDDGNVSGGASVMGVTKEDIEGLHPDKEDKYELMMALFEEAEYILKTEIHVDPQIVSKNMKKATPELFNMMLELVKIQKKKTKR